MSISAGIFTNSTVAPSEMVERHGHGVLRQGWFAMVKAPSPPEEGFLYTSYPPKMIFEIKNENFVTQWTSAWLSTSYITNINHCKQRYNGWHWAVLQSKSPANQKCFRQNVHTPVVASLPFFWLTGRRYVFDWRTAPIYSYFTRCQNYQRLQYTSAASLTDWVIYYFW